MKQQEALSNRLIICNLGLTRSHRSTKMWLCGADEIVEMFKSSFPLSFLFFVPVLILISPVSPAAAAHEFAVFRMQQYDLQGSSYGTFARFFL